MCKNWIEIGVCRYANKCQFAHGDQELVEKSQPINAKYKSKTCTTFQEKLFCPYGKRCLFRHEDRTLEEVRTYSHYYTIEFFPERLLNILKDSSDSIVIDDKSEKQGKLGIQANKFNGSNNVISNSNRRRLPIFQ